MNKNIKEWREEDRPREKMLSKGCTSLTAAELIAILIRSGSVDKSAVDTAQEVLDIAEGRLCNLARMDCSQLQKVNGIGQAKALSIMAAAELGRRIAAEPAEAMPAIRDSKAIAAMMIPLLSGLQHEECWVLYLNRANRLVGKECISKGGISATVIDIKMIVRRAVDRLASGIILVHNHPSGNCQPGRNDIDETAALREAAAYFDISLIDHLIIAGNKYYSFSDEI